MGLLIAAVLGYVALCALCYALQRRLIWFPGDMRGSTPADAGLGYRELSLATDDGEHLRAWLIVPEAPARGVLLYSHGNAGTIEDRVELARFFVGLDLAVLLYDYRGYGDSTGTPSEAGTYADALAAWRELVERQGFAPARIVLYGESLGGGVATELATRVRPAGLLLHAAFSSLPDAAAHHYPWLPVRLLLRSRYDNAAKLATLDVPKLLVHSPEDGVVPFALGERLFRAAAEPKELLVTSGPHDVASYLLREEWKARVRQFLDRALRP